MHVEVHKKKRVVKLLSIIMVSNMYSLGSKRMQFLLYEKPFLIGPYLLIMLIFLISNK